MPPLSWRSRVRGLFSSRSCRVQGGKSEASSPRVVSDVGWLRRSSLFLLAALAGLCALLDFATLHRTVTSSRHRELVDGSAPPAGRFTQGAYACSDFARGDGPANGPADALLTPLPPCRGTRARSFARSVVDESRVMRDRPSGTGADGSRTEVVWPSTMTPAPEGAPPACLALGRVHAITLRVRNESGHVVPTLGGEYFEVRFEGPAVRARPRSTDWGNGTHTIEVLLPDDPLLAGSTVEFSLVLLFRRWGGLGNSPWWFYDTLDHRVLPSTALFTLARAGACVGDEPAPAPPLLLPTRSCRSVDFMAEPFWRGHWVRVPAGAACPPGACSGAPDLLPVPWVYRLPSCYFHLFSPVEARVCLNGSHIFSSGDSNFLDTERNLLAHVLTLDFEAWLLPHDFVLRSRSNDISGHQFAPRATEDSVPEPAVRAWFADAVNHSRVILENGTNPEREGERVWRVGPANFGAFIDDAGRFNMTFRIGNVYNGAPSESGQNWGMAVIYHEGWKRKHSDRFARFREQASLPDVVFVNTGLHDGLRFNEHFSACMDHELCLADMLPFWATLRNMSLLDTPATCGARMIWRNSVAPGGFTRVLPSNPMKMEFFNAQVVRELLELNAHLPSRTATAAADTAAACPGKTTTGSSWSFLDMYDMTFPFHFDNAWNDGGHYGRWNCIGNSLDRCDLVDLMQIHVLLNGLCPVAAT